MDQIDGIDNRDGGIARVTDQVSVRNPADGITSKRRLPVALRLKNTISFERCCWAIWLWP